MVHEARCPVNIVLPQGKCPGRLRFVLREQDTVHLKTGGSVTYACEPYPSQAQCPVCGVLCEVRDLSHRLWIVPDEEAI